MNIRRKLMAVALLIMTATVLVNTVMAKDKEGQEKVEENRTEAAANGLKGEGLEEAEPDTIETISVQEPEKTSEGTNLADIEPIEVPVEVAKKVAYLTFDDGPNKYTTDILKVLAEKEVNATFFFVEPNVRKLPEVVKQVVAEGHYPGLHSVTHDKQKLYHTEAMRVAYEMEATRKAVYEASGFTSNLVRVPYGSKPDLKDEMRDGLHSYLFKMWDWTVDSNDWQYKSNNTQMILENIKKQVKGDVEVVLMHETKGTLEQLPAIIEYLQTQGYSVEAYNPEHHLMVNFWKDERL